MPKTLPQRLQPDSIHEFRAAAWQRHVDAVVLAKEGRRTAAIYLWGYAGEMVLKAAYFEAVRFPPTQPIIIADLQSAKNVAVTWGIFFRNFHDLAGWGRLIFENRLRAPGLTYRDPRVGNRVLAYTQTMDRIWRETIRYHKNVAFPYEVVHMRASAEWLLEHSFDL